MAIPHASSGEPIDVQALGTRLSTEKTVALFKSQDLEVIRLVLPKGKSLPLHHVPSEITIQCIEGKLDISASGASQTLSAGQLLFLSANVLHNVVAQEDASALVTIVLRKSH